MLWHERESSCFCCPDTSRPPRPPAATTCTDPCPQKEWAAGREISQALLAAYLQAEEVALADANGAAAQEGNGAKCVLPELGEAPLLSP